MRPSKTLAILPVLLASYAFASPLEKRVYISDVGAIISPADGTSITPGTPFAFEYGDGWGGACHPGYTPISVGLTAFSPTGSDLNSTFQIPDSDYLYYFGDFLITNDEGLPPMPTPPPPSTFTLPEPLDPIYDGQEIYLSAVEQMFDCASNMNNTNQKEVHVLDNQL
ncbi:hypothetical protein PHLCEN_2v5932 [Hermanssonia centrifuga]|uniref:Uncharacterized protein n=1 Tax=Hermanssonia centrifuga TaxID=98765 RepID=A0A2R6P0W7_9APHY|nr:hypothetical protein PHLCEN_2v5932 [Hermanssonia centrifuga]